MYGSPSPDPLFRPPTSNLSIRHSLDYPGTPGVFPQVQIEIYTTLWKGLYEESEESPVPEVPSPGSGVVSGGKDGGLWIVPQPISYW